MVTPEVHIPSNRRIKFEKRTVRGGTLETHGVRDVKESSGKSVYRFPS